MTEPQFDWASINAKSWTQETQGKFWMVTELQGRGVDGGYLAAFSHMSSLQFGRFFVSLSIFSFSYRHCWWTGLGMDMVDGKAQSGGGDWNGHQDDNFPNDFWTQFSFIFSCFLNCFSYNWYRDSFSSLWCWNPHTLTLDIQDERILVRCCPNNDNLRLDISWWTSPSEFLVV